MSKQEILETLLQVNRKTGEVKTCKAPNFRGRNLESVYGSFSYAKARAYQYCTELLRDISDEVISYGITSNNTFHFTFSAVFITDGIKYVYVATANYDRVYLLDEDK